MIASLQGLATRVHRTRHDAGLYVEGSIVHDVPVARVRLVVDDSWVPVRIGVPPAASDDHGVGERTVIRSAISLAGWLRESWLDRVHVIELEACDYDGVSSVLGQFSVRIPPDGPAMSSLQRPSIPTQSVQGKKRVQVFLHRRGRGGAESWAARVVEGLRSGGRTAVSADFLPAVRPDAPWLEGLWHHTSAQSFAAQVSAADQLITDAKPDVVLCNTLECLAAAEAARQRRVPFVWAIHESYSPGSLWASVFGLRPAIPTMVGALDVCLGRAHSVLFVSNETMYPFLPTLGAAPAHVVPFAVDPLVPELGHRMAASSVSSHVRALALGTLEERKNLVPLVGAFAHARLTLPQLRLTIAGPGDPAYVDHLRTTINRLGQVDAVELVARRVDTVAALSNADLLVSASDVESRSTVILEAWRAGVPVLAVAAAGMRELIQDGVDGVLVPVSDYRALAHAWVDLATRPDVRDQMVSAGAASFQREASRPWIHLVEDVLTDPGNLA